MKYFRDKRKSMPFGLQLITLRYIYIYIHTPNSSKATLTTKSQDIKKRNSIYTPSKHRIDATCPTHFSPNSNNNQYNNRVPNKHKVQLLKNEGFFPGEWVEQIQFLEETTVEKMHTSTVKFHCCGEVWPMMHLININNSLPHSCWRNERS